MTKYTLLKLKPGKRAVWEAWCKELSTTYKQECLEALKEENIVRETCSTFEGNDGFYVLCYEQVADGLSKLPQKIEREVNRRHREVVKECFESVYKHVDGGYDFQQE